MLVAGWYAGLTVLGLAFAYRGGGLSRWPGLLVIAGYLGFVTALAVSVAAGGAVRGPVIVLPAIVIVAAAAVLLVLSPAGRQARRRGPSAKASRGRRESLIPGWTVGQLWRLGLVLCAVIAACDAATGPRVILMGLLVAGPCCALLTGRWVATASMSAVAVGLGVVLGIPDQIFATFIQYAFVSALAVVGLTATTGAVILQRHRA
jgi:hypothetical protein